MNIISLDSDHWLLLFQLGCIYQYLPRSFGAGKEQPVHLPIVEGRILFLTIYFYIIKLVESCI